MDSEVSVVSQSFSKKSADFLRLLLLKIDWNLAFLFTLPIFLMIANSGWIFSYVVRGYIDPWIYFGGFLDLKDHLNIFGGTYYLTRLPWLLPGFLIYHFFSPTVAVYLLHGLFFSVAVGALYLVLKCTVGYRAGLMAAILMGCHYFFLEAVGGDYIDGAGLTYLLLTLLMLVKGAKNSVFHTQLLFAGVFYGCMIYTQLFLISYTPLLFIYYFFTNRQNEQHSILESLKWIICGFLGVTLLLCSINYFLNGTFFFFYPIVRWTAIFVLSGTNPWWASILKWGVKAQWLLLPLIVFIGSVLILIFRRKFLDVRFYNWLVLAQICFVLNVLMYLVFELIVKQPVLQLSYYSSYMMPALFLALGMQIALVIEKLSPYRFYVIISLIVAFSLVSYAFHFNDKQLLENRPYLILFSLLLGLVGYVFLVILSLSRFFKFFGMALLLCVMCVINASCIHKWMQDEFNAAFQKNAWLTVVDSEKAVKSMDPQRVSRFWYNGYIPYGTIYRSVSSIYLWGYRLFNEDFPGLTTPGLTYKLALNDKVFILSDGQNELEEASKSLAQIGFKPELLGERIIQRGEVNYKITHFKVVALEK